MEAYVYFLVEGDLVKIGSSYSIPNRSSTVTPSVELDHSWALLMETRDDAYNCERALQRILKKKWHRVQLDRDGKTEFFDVAAMPDIREIVAQTSTLLGVVKVIDSKALKVLFAEFRQSPIERLRERFKNEQIMHRGRMAAMPALINKQEGERFRSWCEWLAASGNAVAISRSEQGRFELFWCDADVDLETRTSNNFEVFNVLSEGTAAAGWLTARTEQILVQSVFVARTLIDAPIDESEQADATDAVARATSIHFGPGLDILRALPRVAGTIDLEEVALMWNEAHVRRQATRPLA